MTEPNNDEVICPNCTHQFRAIPVNVQKLLAALESQESLSDALYRIANDPPINGNHLAQARVLLAAAGAKESK